MPFGPINQVEAGPLDVGYVEAGPDNGRPVLLLHGWPYDIHSYAEVTPVLAAAGYRVVVPYLRGYGTTRFLSPGTMRNGQQAVLAVDAVALLDALHIESALRFLMNEQRLPTISTRGGAWSRNHGWGLA
jgi:pimeloyl-ACP methyl ester carboxylesterase